MAAYLSPEWLAEADQLAQASETLLTATADVQLVLRQEVAATPLGDVSYEVRFDQGRVGVASVSAGDQEGASPPDITLRQDYRCAVAIWSGTADAHDAFLDGRVRLDGDPRLLTAAAPALEALAEALAPLRAETRT